MSVSKWRKKLLTHEIRKPFNLKKIVGGLLEFTKPNTPADDIPMAVAIKTQQEITKGNLMLSDGRVIPMELDSRRIDSDYEGGSGRINPLIPLNDRKTALAYLGDKQRYNEYIRTVEKRFPKGVFVTYRNIPLVLGRKEPPIYFQVHELQEIRHLAQWDNTYKEPRCVGILAGKEDGPVLGYQFVCPSSLRVLTVEEQYLVNVQHQQTKTKQETAPLSGEEPEDLDRSGG